MYKRLTVNKVRRHYYDKKTNTWKRIKMVTGQDFGNDATSKSGKKPGPKVRLNTIFIPDGTLHKQKRDAKKSIVYHDWLNTKKKGPYFEKDRLAGCCNDIFYYLGGMISFDYGDGYEKFRPYQMQLCTSPLNALSTDCLDEVDCWVKV